MTAFRYRSVNCGPCIGTGFREYNFANERREVVICDVCGGSGLRKERPPLDLRDMLLDEDGEMDS